MQERTPKYVIEVTGSSDRSFGFVFAAVFLVIAFFPLISGGALRVWALVLSGTLISLAVLRPRMLAPANRLWKQIGSLMHRIVSPIALGLVYYFVATPTGIVLRLFGKDPLRLRFDPEAASYWIERDPPGPSANSLNNQF